MQSLKVSELIVVFKLWNYNIFTAVVYCVSILLIQLIILLSR